MHWVASYFEESSNCLIVDRTIASKRRRSKQLRRELGIIYINREHGGDERVQSFLNRVDKRLADGSNCAYVLFKGL